MAYSDVLRAMQQYGSYFNYGNYESTDPYSSGAYGTNIEGILRENPMPVDPIAQNKELRDNLSNTEKSLLRLGQGSTFAGMGGNLKVGAETQKKLGSILGADSDFKPEGTSLATPAFIYGATRDQNPYDTSMLESVGDIATGASLGFSLAGTAGLGPGAGLGIVLAAINARTADKKRKKAEKEYEKAVQARQEDISQAIIDLREKNESMQEAYAWADESMKYSNQYGGNIMAEGGKVKSPYETPKFGSGGNVVTRFLDKLASFFTGYDDDYYRDKDVELDEQGNKIAVLDQETGQYSFSTTDPNVRLSFDPNEGGLQLIDASGQKSNILGQLTKPALDQTPGQGSLMSKNVKNQPLSKNNKIKSGFALDPYMTKSRGTDTPSELQNFRWDLDNALIRENVELFQKGGQLKNIVAEFTGNELVVNDQDEVEAGLATGDFKRAAAPIKRAMGGKLITPGKETHKSNPMPVDSTGTIYTKGGVLPFKVRKGAGIYDHATDQFKSGMDDKQIAMVAKKNIKKWEKNNMT